jgi:uncharacterized protein (TIGR02246 family)
MNTIQTMIENLNKAWNDAFNSGNSQTLAALYATDGTLSPGNGQTLKGREQIQQLFQSFLDAGVHSHTLEIIECGGNDQFMYQVARWGGKGAAQNGVEPAFGGITTSVIEKNAQGQWQTRSHVWNAAG